MEPMDPSVWALVEREARARSQQTREILLRPPDAHVLQRAAALARAAGGWGAERWLLEVAEELAAARRALAEAPQPLPGCRMMDLMPLVLEVIRCRECFSSIVGCLNSRDLLLNQPASRLIWLELTGRVRVVARAVPEELLLSEADLALLGIMVV